MKKGTERDILTIVEAPAFLKVSNRSVYKLVKEGGIPHKKITNTYRFERDALLKWVRGEGW